MNIIRNIFGAIITIIGTFIFQIGFVLMTEDMQDSFAQKLVEKFSERYL